MAKQRTVPLIEAALANNQDEVRRLLESGVDVDGKDRTGRAALHYMAIQHNLEIARLLLDYKATVDIQDSNGNTPLCDAVFESKGRGEMISLFLEFGANRDAMNDYGVSPLGLSKTIANYPVAQFFENRP